MMHVVGRKTKHKDILILNFAKILKPRTIPLNKFASCFYDFFRRDLH